MTNKKGMGLGIGYHPNTPMHKYVQIQAAGSSALWYYKPDRTPRHLRHYLDTPRKPTDVQSFGTVAHVAVLQRPDFDALYVPEPDVPKAMAAEYKKPRATKAYAELVAEHREKHAGAEVIPQELHKNVLALADSVYSLKGARLLLEAPGKTEISALYEHPAGDVRCRFRSDRICAVHGADISFKTTRDASPEWFGREMEKWGYYMAAALYLDGHAALGQPLQRQIVIAAENTAPWCAAVYRVREDALDDGRRLLQHRLHRWREFLDMKKGQEPGYADRVLAMGISEWEMRRVDEEVRDV
jgi:hypothetical protein